jgi:hypothetical protein
MSRTTFMSLEFYVSVVRVGWWLGGLLCVLSLHLAGASSSPTAWQQKQTTGALRVDCYNRCSKFEVLSQATATLHGDLTQFIARLQRCAVSLPAFALLLLVVLLIQGC